MLIEPELSTKTASGKPAILPFPRIYQNTPGSQRVEFQNLPKHAALPAGCVYSQSEPKSGLAAAPPSNMFYFLFRCTMLRKHLACTPRAGGTKTPGHLHPFLPKQKKSRLQTPPKIQSSRSSSLKKNKTKQNHSFSCPETAVITWKSHNHPKNPQAGT